MLEVSLEILVRSLIGPSLYLLMTFDPDLLVFLACIHNRLKIKAVILFNFALLGLENMNFSEHNSHQIFDIDL